MDLLQYMYDGLIMIQNLVMHVFSVITKVDWLQHIYAVFLFMQDFVINYFDRSGQELWYLLTKIVLKISLPIIYICWNYSEEPWFPQFLKVKKSRNIGAVPSSSFEKPEVIEKKKKKITATKKTSGCENGCTSDCTSPTCVSREQQIRDPSREMQINHRRQNLKGNLISRKDYASWK